MPDVACGGCGLAASAGFLLHHRAYNQRSDAPDNLMELVNLAGGGLIGTECTTARRSGVTAGWVWWG